MVFGILAGMGVTALIFLAVWLLRNCSTPPLMVYLLLMASLVVLSVEGVWMVKTIRASRTISRVVALAQDTVILNLPEQGSDTTLLSSQEASEYFGVNVLKRKRRSIWTFVITAIALGGLEYLAFPDVSRRKKAASGAGNFRRPRRALKGRTTPRYYHQ